MRSILLIAGIIAIGSSLFAQDTAYQSVTRQLLTIDELDQRYRGQIEFVERKYGRESKEIAALYVAMQRADSVNMTQVASILDKYGWLGENEIGNQANNALFAVIQHADQGVQEKYLPVMREAVRKGNAKANALALLEDRVALRQGRMQNYGSQIFWSVSKNRYYVLPLDDPDNVDKRRAAVGLNPLAEYVSVWKIVWNVEKYKKDLPGLVKECKLYFPNCCSRF